jgi:hypothetical protein
LEAFGIAIFFDAFSMAKVSFFCFRVLPGWFRIQNLDPSVHRVRSKEFRCTFSPEIQLGASRSAISPRSTPKSMRIPAPPLQRNEASQGWPAIAGELPQ